MYTLRHLYPIIIGAIISAALIAIVLYPLQFAEPPPTKIDIRLSDIQLENASSGTLYLTFDIYNGMETLVIPGRLEYELFADGRSMGNGEIIVDVLHEHAARIPPGQTARLTDYLEYKQNEQNSLIFSRILDNADRNMTGVNWSAKGTGFISTGKVMLSYEFSDPL